MKWVFTLLIGWSGWYQTNPLQNTRWQTLNPVIEKLTFQFTASDTAYIFAKDSLIGTALYSIRNRTLTWKDIGGDMSCGKNNAGKYFFVITEDTLRFYMNQDSCEQRAAIFPNLVLKKAGK
ncbi:MAG: hypothetical protein QM731_19540 [Chitinophagaceae bacterium]